MCIPADSMLWALVTRMREGGYTASEADLRALLRSGCSAERVQHVLASQTGATFGDALAALRRVVGSAA
jgi:hypothetical protein